MLAAQVGRSRVLNRATVNLRVPLALLVQNVQAFVLHLLLVDNISTLRADHGLGFCDFCQRSIYLT